MIGERTCAKCGEIFYPLKRWALYCSADCNRAAYLDRKIAMKKRGIDALIEDLDEPQGPSEAQQADRERRKADTAEAMEAAKNTPTHTKQVVDAFLKREEEENRSKASESFLQRKYGSGDES